MRPPPPPTCPRSRPPRPWGSLRWTDRASAARTHGRIFKRRGTRRREEPGSCFVRRFQVSRRPGPISSPARVMRTAADQTVAKIVVGVVEAVASLARPPSRARRNNGPEDAARSLGRRTNRFPPPNLVPSWHRAVVEMLGEWVPRLWPIRERRGRPACRVIGRRGSPSRANRFRSCSCRWPLPGLSSREARNADGYLTGGSSLRFCGASPLGGSSRKNRHFFLSRDYLLSPPISPYSLMLDLAGIPRDVRSCTRAGGFCFLSVP